MEQLEIGLYVYIFDKDNKGKEPVVGKIIEDLGECKNSSGNIYRLIDENDQEYEIIYPESKTNYYILTRNDYCDRLRALIEEKTKQIELLEEKVNEIRNGACTNFNHEFSDWKNDSWFDNARWIRGDGNEEGYHEITHFRGKTRVCLICGYCEHKEESKKIIKRYEYKV
jgi:hypothetical protein